MQFFYNDTKIEDKDRNKTILALKDLLWANGSRICSSNYFVNCYEISKFFLLILCEKNCVGNLNHFKPHFFAFLNFVQYILPNPNLLFCAHFFGFAFLRA